MKWFHGFALIISGEILITLIFYLTVGSFDLPHPKQEEDEQYADGMENPIMVSKLYDYYNIEAGMASSGLSTGTDSFLLNGKRLTILSGALHYFRVHPAHWRDRLRKLRAMGCNTVETYIPWNLHEPEKDVYDFGVEEYKTDYQFSEWLNVVQFIEMAEEEDLFVIIRPGPYIGADWDFGGLPSYLLSIPGLKVRTNDDLYLDRVDKYFETLLPRLAPLTVERGGPIIMFQIENEYGYFSNSSESNEHLEYLQMKMESLGINSFFSTCDDVALVGRAGSLVEKGVLMTATFQDNVEHELSTLRELQPYRPAMVMEFSSGRIDHWGQTHTTRSELDYSKKLFYIISFPASINLYLFHGGTNFGFMSGANQWVSRDRIIYEPSTTSYDRDALLTENGDYTKKYFLTRELFVDVQKFFGIYVPDPPKIEQILISPAIEPHFQMDYMDIIMSIPSDNRILSDQLMQMELLHLKSKMRTGEKKGQSYGYTLYRIFLPVDEDPEIQIFGRVNDTVILLVDGKRFTDVMRSAKQIHDFGFWRACKYENEKKKINLRNGSYTFDFLVENMGRNSFGFTLEDFDQKKGLSQGSVTISGLHPEGIWEIYTLDFQPKWVKNLNKWRKWTSNPGDLNSPTMFKFELELEEEDIHDTFLNMREWGKGVVFVNNFNIGRYFSIGPQLSLYIPGPLLVAGVNFIIVFEHYTHPGALQFSSLPVYE